MALAVLLACYVHIASMSKGHHVCVNDPLTVPMVKSLHAPNNACTSTETRHHKCLHIYHLPQIISYVEAYIACDGLTSVCGSCGKQMDITEGGAALAFKRPKPFL